MRLDSAAVRALNVMESKTDANKNFSLFGLMNRTCTAGVGKRLLHMWLKQPLLDVTDQLEVGFGTSVRGGYCSSPGSEAALKKNF